MQNQDCLIRDMDVCERPEIRLARVGVEAMSDAELLTLALHYPSIGKAENLLARQSLKELLALDYVGLLRLLPSVRAGELLAFRELFKRVDTKPDELPTMRSMSDVVSQAIEIRDKKKEYLLAFFLNARHQLIAKEVISIGTLTASLAHPREIFAPAIGKAAAGVILAHNHPSGDPSPSDEDTRLTKRISQAGHILGIELLDHLIVAANGSYSFKASGAL